MTFVTNSRKSQKSPSGSGRPRGRPPGIQKFPQLINSNSIIQNEDGSNNLSTSPIYSSTKNPKNTYCINPFLEPNILAAMLGPSFNANIIDSAMNYFNQTSVYQDIFHRCQNNVNTISNVRNCNKNSGYSYAGNNIPITDSSLNIPKGKTDISITPVTDLIRQVKPKCAKLTTNITQHENLDISRQFPKSVKAAPSSRLPLFKSIHTPQHVSQSLTDQQISLITKSVSSEDNSSRNFITCPQSNHTSISKVGVNFTSPQPGTSLQHKLLSKKYGQHPYQLVGIHKPKQIKTILPSNHTNILKNISTSYKATDSTATNLASLSTSKYINLHSSLQKSINTNVEVPILTKSFQNTSTVNNTLPTISHLQQHSHLEVIPQIMHIQQDNKLINKSERLDETINSSGSKGLFRTEHVSIYELSKYKKNDNYPTPQTEKDNVEIITLDD
jgi:hypothetical protein